MSLHDRPPGWWRRLNIRVASSPLAAQILAVVFHHLDRAVARVTRGRHTATSVTTGLPLIWLTTTGARTGKQRVTPLIGLPDGDRLIVVASNWGQDHSPSWYYNLCATPHATVARDGRAARTYRAVEAEGDLYDRAWQLAVSYYPGYAAYRGRTRRHIPVMILIPE
jgi:deazaflavin-dependent oxidoreductase (nitroreductase family)